MPLYPPATLPVLNTSLLQLTVATLGASTASALPLFPTRYAKILDTTGVSYVLPLYTSS